ncbi:hypothetical protein [Deinococcus sp. 12RED42]|nr:hypothetical protein [Deinococcus sp. 12RED42]
MSLPQPMSRSETSVRRQLLLPFFAYFLLLASTSFIAGGIVHLGLGENTAYYLALAVLGVVCFTVGNYLQEFVLRKKTRPTNLGAFLLVSFVLSVGMGMMTGGVQHYLDNPAYSSVLIPVGLILAVLAFLSREGVKLGPKLPALMGGTVAVAALLFGGLSSIGRAITVPGTAGHAHGSAAAEPAQATATSTPAAAIVSAAPATETTAPAAQTTEAVHAEPHTDAHPEGGEDGHDDH